MINGVPEPGYCDPYYADVSAVVRTEIDRTRQFGDNIVLVARNEGVQRLSVFAAARTDAFGRPEEWLFAIDDGGRAVAESNPRLGQLPAWRR